MPKRVDSVKHLIEVRRRGCFEVVEVGSSGLQYRCKCFHILHISSDRFSECIQITSSFTCLLVKICLWYGFDKSCECSLSCYQGVTLVGNVIVNQQAPYDM